MLERVKKYWAFRNRAPEIAVAFTRFSIGDSISLVRSYLGIGSTKYPIQVKTKNGFYLELNTLAEVKVLWHVFVRECYSVPVECQNIVDAGANIGIFAIFAASRCPNARIFSLEPFPSTFRALSANVDRNNLQLRVRALPVGLGATGGTSAMLDESDSTAIKIVDAALVSHGSIELVSVVTLMDFMAEQKLAEIDFLKVDIEGSEWPVVLLSPPELWQKIRHLQLEYHSVNAAAGYHPQMLLDFLQLAGHSVIEHTEDAFNTGVIRSELRR